MFIGEVSKITGLSRKAIRLYEEKGLIPTPQRRGRYRVYSDHEIEVLHLIIEAKSLGVTLTKLKGILVSHNGELDWNRVNQFLHEVKQELEIESIRISENLKRVNNCITSINSCSKVVDSAPKGRE
jgi:DNA-binding transcriptional MerR regulator